MLHLINNLSAPNSKVDVRVVNEPLADGSLVTLPPTTLTLPSRKNRQFAYIHLDRDVLGNPVLVTNLSQAPVSSVSRLISAWGTEPDSVWAVRQCQTDRLVQFNGDHAFDADLAVQGGFYAPEWIERWTYGAWPTGLCAAVYARMEAILVSNVDSNGLGLAQVNACGVQGSAGTTNVPSMGFIAQEKGLVRQDQGGETSGDMIRVVIKPGHDRWWLRTNENCRGNVLVSGYELLPM